MVTKPSALKIFTSFLKLGLIAFGGPTAIAYVREMVVDKKKWMDEKNFNNGVALSQIIPGASVMQVVAYVGLNVGGFAGALAAFMAYVLPAFFMMLVLTIIYIHLKTVPETVSIFEALRIVVVALAANGTLNFGKKSIKNIKDVFLLAIAAILFILKFSPFVVIFIAMIIGFLTHREDFTELSLLLSSKPHIANEKLKIYKYVAYILVIIALFNLSLWLINPELFSLSTLMMKVDIMAFGGGYGSVPFMLHDVVDVEKLIDAKTFMDGIALGQITPGPIVITATFVGYLVKGLVGSIIATISVFTPSFIILLSTVPIFDSLKNNIIFKNIFHSILVSFVGLMIAVTIRFALSVDWTLSAVIIGLMAFIGLYKKYNILLVIILSLILGYLIL
ncbi:chromate transporter [Methanococcus aeolicus]|uniref:chromate transporter n=1 Tax=Methanococcus aeolicus TaxID=42879 RepID=UPI0021CA999E|nr:chromate transporter [Methanococcus aeolicus]UXM84656.1 chromate transporter [Methanococcus aeolicus]